MLEKLINSAKETRSILCLCIDPIIEHIPLVGLPEHRILRYYASIFEAMDKAECYPATLKFNEAYFLSLDDPYTTRHGSNALVELILMVRSHKTLSKLPIIMDCKRGDIGKSMAHYAKYYFENWGIDAITVSPYIGEEGFKPFEKYPGKCIYVLAKTSNEASVHDVDVKSGSTLSKWICQWISKANAEHPTLGAVISGRMTKDFEEHLACISPTVPVLIPGIGAQGGNAKEIAAFIAKTENPLYHRIAIGRSIAYAWVEKGEVDYAGCAIEALKTAQEAIRGELNGIL